MILSCAEMKALEESAFRDCATADALMEEAGIGIALAVQRYLPEPGACIAVFGKGNNGGDALVAARHLAAHGWKVTLVPAFVEAEWGALTQSKFSHVAACERGDLRTLEHPGGQRLIVLDGLLGIGASGALREPILSAARAINALRARSGAQVFALDIPTGLDGDSGSAQPDCVVADTTLTIGFAKKGLLSDAATNHVGRLCVVPLRELTARATAGIGDESVTTPEGLIGILPRRAYDTHKGTYGRVGIVAGSPGMLGAAALCAAGCVRMGAGLVTLYAGLEAAEQLALMVPREVMVKVVASYREVMDARHDIFAIGPGLGMKHAEEVKDLVRSITHPAVVDADGLNAIATEPALLNSVAGERLLTPHPGEMARLAPDLAGENRAAMTRAFLSRYPRTTLLLKGARTLVGKNGARLAYNTTGNPGMATGGMGDVLTGVLAALIGQGLRLYDAARLGAWLCGRAAELAIEVGCETEETLLPTRLLDFLGPAIRELRAG
jgi:ADP-dependent NAD(P)H-hydrate dehydratase / NAD(P)H-hydrate epimerase